LAALSLDYLDKALADFSGYLALDEVSDGPFCVLSAVDNRRHHRLCFRVLDHDPTHKDCRAWLKELQGHVQQRRQTVRGITTDGSPLYPRALKELWPDVPHQICAFHVLKAITKAVLHALAKVRKQRKAKILPQPRGRPSQDRTTPARQAARQKQQVADRFEHRHLFVRHQLSATQRVRLRKRTRGLLPLRALRGIMDEV